MRARSLLALTGLLVGIAVAAAPAAAAAGTSYTWVGGSSMPVGDGTTWTDPDNWSPNGVPGNGDSVIIAPPTADVCYAHVTAVPSGIELNGLTLEDAVIDNSLCDASIAGGSLSVAGAFTWHAGVVSTPITLLPSATGTISPGAANAASELDADLDVRGALHLSGNVGGAPDQSLVLSAGTAITVAPGAALGATGSNHIESLSCCTDPAKVINHGTITADSALAFDYVELDQDGLLDASGSTTEITSWAAPTTAADGARYSGGGTYRVSGASIDDTLAGTQTIDAGTTVVLGGGTEPYVEPAVPADGNEQLSGTFTLAGAGRFVWAGGHLVGHATLATKAGVSIGDNTEAKYVDGPANTAGSVTFAAPTTIAGGTRQNPNYLNLQDESTMTFASRAQVGAGVAIEHGRPVNTGQLTVTATVKNPTRVDAAGLVNRGQLTVAAGTLRVDDDIVQKAGRTTIAPSAGLVEVGSSSVVRVRGGRLQGTGRVTGNVAVTGGVVAPGAGGHQIGTLTVTGDYSQSTHGGLAVDEGARSGDVLAVGGTARFGGGLAVHNTVAPHSVDLRTLVTAQAIGGRFACVVTAGTGATGHGPRHWVAVLGSKRASLESEPGRRTSC